MDNHDPWQEYQNNGQNINTSPHANQNRNVLQFSPHSTDVWANNNTTRQRQDVPLFLRRSSSSTSIGSSDHLRTPLHISHPTNTINQQTFNISHTSSQGFQDARAFSPHVHQNHDSRFRFQDSSQQHTQHSPNMQLSSTQNPFIFTNPTFEEARRDGNSLNMGFDALRLFDDPSRQRFEATNWGNSARSPMMENHDVEAARRQQMNQQMSALYLKPLNSNNTFHSQQQISGMQMRGQQFNLPSPQHQQQQQFSSQRKGRVHSPIRRSNSSPITRTPAHPQLQRSNTPRPLRRGIRSPTPSGSSASTIHVTPEVTSPNEAIKVQVSLQANECLVGRVLLAGLFRIGQPNNEKPIFVKQILFENKLNRNYRLVTTRINFRAPRSPGEFEFRVFEKLPQQENTNMLQLSSSPPPSSSPPGFNLSPDPNADSNQSTLNYSPETIAVSNKLKVGLEYAHFLEVLRTCLEKLTTGQSNKDAGLILSGLVACLRLIEQVEVAFVHGQSLFTNVMAVIFNLLESYDELLLEYMPTDSIPSPVETVHGTTRNLFNAIQYNPYMKIFLTSSSEDNAVETPLEGQYTLTEQDVWDQLILFQSKYYCAVSGFYFVVPETKEKYWKETYGFLPKSDKESSQISEELENQLTNWLKNKASQLIPDSGTFLSSRQAIFKILDEQVLKKLSMSVTLKVFGSSANGFGSFDSDLDMCLVLDSTHRMDNTIDIKRNLLKEAATWLHCVPSLFSNIDTSRLSARIPIIMFDINLPQHDEVISCDLCIENELAIRNTALLRTYAIACDDRLRILAYVLKSFVKRRRMNSAAEGTLSTYGYLLLLINFLQSVQPPILPILQRLPPQWNGDSFCKCTKDMTPCDLPTCDLKERSVAMSLPTIPSSHPSVDTDNPKDPLYVETYFYEPSSQKDIDQLKQYGAKNTTSLGRLWLDFLQYYALEFDPSREVVSIRMRRNLLKMEKINEKETKMGPAWRLHTRLSIEDPFETSYDVAHVLKGSRDKYIRLQFVRAYLILLRSSQGPTIQSIDEVMENIMEQVNDLPFAPSRWRS